MIAVLAAVLCPVFAMAQFNISGKVSEKNNNSTLPGATIRLKGKTTVSASDANGKYEFKNLPSGNYTLVVSFLGYQTQ